EPAARAAPVPLRRAPPPRRSPPPRRGGRGRLACCRAARMWRGRAGRLLRLLLAGSVPRVLGAAADADLAEFQHDFQDFDANRDGQSTRRRCGSSSRETWTQRTCTSSSSTWTGTAVALSPWVNTWTTLCPTTASTTTHDMQQQYVDLYSQHNWVGSDNGVFHSALNAPRQKDVTNCLVRALAFGARKRALSSLHLELSPNSSCSISDGCMF
ncbi:unnamed protein product, partial [Prorocentrum cordatum]